MPRRLLVVVLAALMAGAACGGSSKPKAGSASSPSTARTGPTTSAPTPVIGASGAIAPGTWLMAQKDETRSGADPVLPDLTRATRRWQSVNLDGDVYGQPLVAGNQVIVATTNDTVFSFDAGTGKQQWSAHVGTPVPARDLPCGNVDPVGITGTPAIDRGTGLVYAVAMVAGIRHELVALRLGDGKEAFRKAVDAPGADPKFHNQRGALLIANGRVYAPYGGRYGDCGTYHGSIVSVALDGTGAVESYVTPSQNEAGMWSPGGVVSDGKGALFAATGNSSSQSTFDYANAVIRLDRGLRPAGYWAAKDWKTLNSGDVDLGSESPAFVPAAGGWPDRVLVAGKAGVAYVLDPSRLGGIGGELSNKKLCNAAFGGTARVGRRVYVSCRDGLHAVDVADKAMNVVWTGPRFDAGPPIVAGGLVWVVDVGGNVLYGLDPASGQARVHDTIGDVTNFATPGAGAGAVYVSGARTVIAYG
ncbi:MAG: Pyrrolo-quinoline quinone [Acidimicrobiales bacterium]|jgi:outer membrane protein assembly factor BamB|nr:Pyrrolo-quinoline quinone [Acidimicrobiales bacterium]